MQTQARQHVVKAMTNPASGRPRALLALAAVLLLCGCHISRSKDAHDDVSIDTPLGGLSVKRDPAAVLGKVGLPSYPGAQPVAEGKGNHDSANVDLSFGGYKLQVLVVKLRTTDDASQVQAFYRKALSQYSDVVACHDSQPIATPKNTGMGLTCSKDKHVTTDTDEKSGDVELKAGSPSRQHIVVIRTRDGETTMDLVSLDLPKGMAD